MLCVRMIAMVLVFAAAALGEDNIFVNCGKGASLQSAVSHAEPRTAITASGACKGPITIARDGVRIQGLTRPRSLHRMLTWSR